jgi:hypothetical protein
MPARGLSLTGLTGWGSIPLGITCLGGLLSLLGLTVLGFIAEVPHKRGEQEVRMPQTGTASSDLGFRIKKSVISTIWAIGTAMWSGVALSG